MPQTHFLIKYTATARNVRYYSSYRPFFCCEIHFLEREREREKTLMSTVACLVFVKCSPGRTASFQQILKQSFPDGFLVIIKLVSEINKQSTLRGPGHVMVLPCEKQNILEVQFG